MSGQSELSVRSYPRLAEARSTRLAKRGNKLIEIANEYPLVVISLVTNEKSIFIMSVDWDMDAFSQSRFFTALGSHHGYSGRWDEYLLPKETLAELSVASSYSWNNQKREMVLYEFDSDGRFLQKHMLPLIKLKLAGQLEIRSRRPGVPLVGEHFIHFHELMRIKRYSRPVRVDYIFDLKGQRLAAWSNETFFDQFRTDDEPNIPSRTMMKPNWLIGSTLIACQPEGYSLARFNLMCDFSHEYHRHVDYQDEHAIGLVSVDDMARQCREVPTIYLEDIFPGSGMLPSTEFGRDPAELYLCSFPSASAFVGHMMYQNGWDLSSSSDNGVWFFKGQYSESEWNVWHLQILPEVVGPASFEIEPPLEELLDFLRNANSSLYVLINEVAAAAYDHTDSLYRPWRLFTEEIELRDIQLYASDFLVYEGCICVQWALDHTDGRETFWVQYLLNKGTWNLEPLRTFSVGSDISFTLDDLVAEEWDTSSPYGSHIDSLNAPAPYFFDNHTTSHQYLITRFFTADSRGKQIDTARTGIIVTDISNGREKCFVPRVPTDMIPNIEVPNYLEY